MYLSLEQIRWALGELEAIHSFYLTTFLVCKVHDLPIGTAVEFHAVTAEKRFLDRYYKPDPSSAFYYRVSRKGQRVKRWLAPEYASSGGQKTRTTTLAKAFLHIIGSEDWGWAKTYLDVLASEKFLDRPISAFALAVWLYRERNWPAKTRPADVVPAFLREFKITDMERRRLFDVSAPEASIAAMFQDRVVVWDDLRPILGSPPDSRPQEGGSLKYLEMRGVGPTSRLRIEPGDRVTLVTGDNGLGKTFILECAWWALSGYWADLPAYPRADATRSDTKIIYEVSGATQWQGPVSIAYDWRRGVWPSRPQLETIPGLLLYARVDGSFAVWDPAKYARLSGAGEEISDRYYSFKKEEVWDGVERTTRGRKEVLCNGLLRDWVTWQNKPEQYPFKVFETVLHELSPSDLGELKCAAPVRLSIDAREIPTIQHSYGVVPIIHASAGVKRIVSLAYLLVWAWHEHRTQSELIRKPPADRMVVLVDEMEAHLHPKWQRVILPALLKVTHALQPELKVQFLIASHSPLVMASMEPQFDAKSDKLYHLDVRTRKRSAFVELEEQEFVRNGPVDSWLTSDTFELAEPRSLEAERAIQRAVALQESDHPASQDVEAVSHELESYLSDNDEFWPRWTFFAQQHGVNI